MEQKQIVIFWDRNADEEQKKFAVETAQIIGFLSDVYVFPSVREGNPDCEPVLDLRSGDGRGWGREQLVQLYYRYEGKDARSVSRPEEYYSATEQAPAEQKNPTGGLELLFSSGWMLQDTDRDGLPDCINCRILLPEEATDSIYQSACDLAVRLGMESAGIEYPLLLEKDDGISNLLRFTGKGKPEIRLVQEMPRKIVEIHGNGKELQIFMETFATEFPLAGDHSSLREAFQYLKDTLDLKTPDGYGLYLEAFGPKDMLLPAGADPEVFRRRWPEKTFYRYNDSRCEAEWNCQLDGETLCLRKLIKDQVLQQVNAGDTIEVTAGLWQGRSERARLEDEIKADILDRGAARASVRIICAYKEGLSWLEEVFVPAAAEKGTVAHIEVAYNRYVSVSSSGADRRMENPPKWLQDLYPADALIAGQLGIDRENIAFFPYEGSEALTYEAKAYDTEGRLLLSQQWMAHAVECPYLKDFPQAGTAMPSTGFLEVVKNGDSILETRIATDAERLWEAYQKDILPRLRDYTERMRSGEPSKWRQPFFSRLELEVSLGGTERFSDDSAEMISSGEALDENLHHAGQEYFRQWGKSLGADFRAPGLILPKIHLQNGPPVMKAILYGQQGEAPSLTPLDTTVRCIAVSMDNGRLCIEAEAELSRTETCLLEKLNISQEPYLDDLRKCFAGYGSLKICSGGISAVLQPEEKEKVRKDLSINELNLMETVPIGYEAYAELMEQLRRVKGLTVYEVGKSFQGRRIYAIEPECSENGYVSRTKRLIRCPSLLVNGRHHANEVSATNAALLLCRELAANPMYEGIVSRLNLVIVPMENVDSAAMHEKLQREHPHWQFHSCYTNSAGEDLMPQYYIEDTVFTEAKVFPKLLEEKKPDAVIDCHGVPHHEMPRLFNPLMEYKGLWIPRAVLCTFYFHVTGEAYSSNVELNRHWEAAVARAYAEDAGFAEKNRKMENRFRKYMLPKKAEDYASEWDGNLLRYWVPSPYNPSHPYPTVRYPWNVSVMFTAEAADETAFGQELQQCAQLHVRHILTGMHFLLNARYVAEEKVRIEGEGLSIGKMRQRPLLPPEENEKRREK